MVKHLPANSMPGSDPLEKELTTHSRLLAWELPGTEEPGGLQSMGLRKSQTGLRLKGQGPAVTGRPRISALGTDLRGWISVKQLLLLPPHKAPPSLPSSPESQAVSEYYQKNEL